jgi:integrase
VHRDQWASTLDAYCASIRDVPIDSVDTIAVLGVLKPIWATIPSTARRVRGRIENVLDFAAAHKWRAGENPARWRGHLQSILPTRQKLEQAHHRALPYQQIPALMARLREKDFATNRALQFTVLCATRTSETLGARFEEFDLDAALWTVPATRTKTGGTHRIPLSEPALAIVRHAAEIRRSDFVFPGRRAEQPLSRTVMITELRRLGVASTAHGLRSSFRDWAGDETNCPREICEAALGHAVTSRTESAYRRSDALERRRQLMQSWARYCEPESGNVISLGSRK